MRLLLSTLAALTLASGAQAASYFSLNDDHARFGLLSGNNLVLSSGSIVNADVGATNLANGSTTVNGEAHFRAGVTCNPCGTVTGGLVTDSAEYLDSLAAWSTLISEVHALPVTGSVGSIVFSSATFTSGIWSAGTVYLTTGNTLTLDAQGDPDAQFVLKLGSFLMDGTSDIVLLNGAQAENVLLTSPNVFLSTSRSLEGMIYSSGPLTRSSASDDVLTLVSPGNLSFGGTLARGAAVASPIPEPASAWLLLGGGAALLTWRRARR
jgi:hypothetical protein